jgi:hypothetical protein
MLIRDSIIGLDVDVIAGTPVASPRSVVDTASSSALPAGPAAAPARMRMLFVVELVVVLVMQFVTTVLASMTV